MPVLSPLCRQAHIISHQKCHAAHKIHSYHRKFRKNNNQRCKFMLISFATERKSLLSFSSIKHRHQRDQLSFNIIFSCPFIYLDMSGYASKDTKFQSGTKTKMFYILTVRSGGLIHPWGKTKCFECERYLERVLPSLSLALSLSVRAQSRLRPMTFCVISPRQINQVLHPLGLTSWIAELYRWMDE